MTIVSDRRAETATPIIDLLADRWSPRSYDPAGEVSDEQLDALLEAARWAPSGSNNQPRRFVVARRGTEDFDRIVARLSSGNRTWAQHAAVLVVAVAELRDADGKVFPSAVYDTGQSIAHLSVQAHVLDLHTHQMGGIDGAGIAEDFGIPARFAVQTVTAIGTLAPEAVAVDPAFRDRDAAPRSRKPLSELVNPADWS